MATIINNPAPVTTTDSSASGNGFLIGVVVLVILAILFLVYGLPYLGNMTRGPQINVPGKVDVNVHTPTTK